MTVKSGLTVGVMQKITLDKIQGYFEPIKAVMAVNCQGSVIVSSRTNVTRYTEIRICQSHTFRFHPDEELFSQK